MASPFVGLPQPKDAILRPLNGGMVLNKTSQMLDPKECVLAENYFISETGPRRRPGYSVYGGLAELYDIFSTIDYKMIDMFNFWTTAVGELEQMLLLISAGPLYQVSFSGITEIPWYYDTGLATIADGIVTVPTADFYAGDVLADDIFRVGSYESRIAQVISAQSFSLVEDVPNMTSVSYSVHRSFNTDDNFLTDFVVYDSEVIFTDYNRPLQVFKYDAASNAQVSAYIDSDDYKIDSGSGPEDFVAACVAVFQDRVFVGNTMEVTDGIRRQRIRWSTATNSRDFSEETAWLDLTGIKGSIRRLVPLGNTLIVYCDDAIFIGVPTNNPFLPVAFQRSETTSVGLVGSKAVARFLDGHFFIGQDDMYLMTARGAERVGSSVVKATIKKSQYRERCYVSVDPENDRVVFGFTEDEAKMTKLWSFFYKTQAWSYTALSTYMIANPLLSFTLTWAELSGFTWESLSTTFPTWESMSLKENSIPFYIEQGGGLRRLSQDRSVDSIKNEAGDIIDSPIIAVYETGDFDFNDPDGLKTFLRLGMKIDFDIHPETAVQFVIQGSPDRGRSWASLGTLLLDLASDEGYVNFLMTSSHVRFRITTTAAIAPFTIVEMIVKIRTRGREHTTGMQGT